jgi:hypothetical protein
MKFNVSLGTNSKGRVWWLTPGRIYFASLGKKLVRPHVNKISWTLWFQLHDTRAAQEK